MRAARQRIGFVSIVLKRAQNNGILEVSKMKCDKCWREAEFGVDGEETVLCADCYEVIGQEEKQ